MLTKLQIILKPYLKAADRLEDKFPVFSSIVFQLLVGVGVISTVGLIALCGASIIWCFYCLMEML